LWNKGEEGESQKGKWSAEVMEISKGSLNKPAMKKKKKAAR